MKSKTLIALLLLIISACSNKSLVINEYDNSVKKLYTSKSFLQDMAPFLDEPVLNFSFMLMTFNDMLFQDGKPSCDLSNKKNNCFKLLSTAEATMLLLQDEAKKNNIPINTKPFYVWKTAVLNGENIENYLSSLTYKEFKIKKQ